MCKHVHQLCQWEFGLNKAGLCHNNRVKIYSNTVEGFFFLAIGLFLNKWECDYSLEYFVKPKYFMPENEKYFMFSNIHIFVQDIKVNQLWEESVQCKIKNINLKTVNLVAFSVGHKDCGYIKDM